MQETFNALELVSSQSTNICYSAPFGLRHLMHRYIDTYLYQFWTCTQNVDCPCHLFTQSKTPTKLDTKRSLVYRPQPCQKQHTGKSCISTIVHKETKTAPWCSRTKRSWICGGSLLHSYASEIFSDSENTHYAGCVIVQENAYYTECSISKHLFLRRSISHGRLQVAGAHKISKPLEVLAQSMAYKVSRLTYFLQPITFTLIKMTKKIQTKHVLIVIVSIQHWHNRNPCYSSCICSLPFEQ